MKLPVRKRPGNSSAVLLGSMNVSGLVLDVVPAGWTYFDDDLAEFLIKLHEDYEQREKAEGEDRMGYVSRK